MVKAIVIDTSSILAMAKEDENGEAEDNACKGKLLFAPESVRWEVVNALRQNVFKKLISPSVAERALETALQYDIQYVDVDMRAALKLAVKNDGLLAYDAFVLQCALELDLPLLTSEKDRSGKMPAYARAMGIRLVRATQ